MTLAPGQRTIVHKHGVPLFAYILEGELTVDYGAHCRRTCRQGQAFMEGMAVAHFGTNPGAQPVRLLAVYLGAKGAEDVIADDKRGRVACKIWIECSEIRLLPGEPTQPSMAPGVAEPRHAATLRRPYHAAKRGPSERQPSN